MKLVVITDTGEQIEARCDVCRHWDSGLERQRFAGIYEDGSEDYEEEKFPDHRKCLMVVHLQHEGTDPADATRPAYTMDASGFQADLWTRTTFGCALFAAKDPT